MFQLGVPLGEVVEFLNVGRRRHVVIEEASIEQFLKEKVAASLPASAKVDIQNVKSICQYLRRLTKRATAGSKQVKQLQAKVAKAPPIKVQYFVGDESIKAFVDCLQMNIRRLESSQSKKKSKKKSKPPKAPGKSPRNIRRMKSMVLKELKEKTGQEHVLVSKESPRKTVTRLDQAGVSLRKYRQLKLSNQPSEKKLTTARNTLNEHATDVGMLLKNLLSKCRCDGPARVKVSVDGHNPSRNISAVTFSLSLVCERDTQSSKYIVPVISLPGAETYELVRDSSAWEQIERELNAVIDVGGRHVNVEYYLCADLKSILLYLGYKSANGRDVCIYCSCNKGRWGACCADGKCQARFRQAPDGSIALPALRPSDPGYKQPPLVDITRYKFVIIDILHLYLRVTDQLFVRCCNFMDKRQIGEFLAVCQHHKLSAFHLRDENGKLRFSNLDKSKREKMMEAVFLKEAVLRTLMPPSRADRVIAVVEKFQQVWKLINSDAPNLEQLQASVVAFTKQFRKSFASDELPNYVHMMCHIPLLIEHFGSLRAFQQQRVEALNHAINVRVRSVTRPGAIQMQQAVQAVNRSLWYV
ncbi:uncharacterized protein LOC122370995 [Amphibalanus amphitrite]|uniref:uncharacterized protein LOC122370995 n=1 Tax=Amphibalanus amphitrite TaxID=1232801 RepID=UPI001C90AE33|nr:uncharacterized protein LOC122370995 [Amphibalanus amphitrite]XP_043202960.1 uncharacterized protein LOC122370995 [Amphibalanus amphitrite]XP_043202961.1 uncharacterized protein LOC122370995 [Amphibalanus amphitrite]